MKIGIDIHGVCNKAPKFFSELSRLFVEAGHDIIVITGRMESHGAIEELNELGISYTKFFSIIDYHIKKGSNVTFDENGNPWICDELWNSTKSEICEIENIDFHIDDSSIYGQYFKTPYAQIIIN